MFEAAKECIDFLDQLREQSKEREDTAEFDNVYNLVVHNPNGDPPKRDGKWTRLFKKKKNNKRKGTKKNKVEK